MNDLLRQLFFLLIVRPLVLVVLGMNVRHRDRLPAVGPAIIVANHNSHLDALALMTLFPWKTLRHLRPVAAADYFLRNRGLAWFATRIMGIIPIQRGGGGERDPLRGTCEALESGAITILFPEGTRGEPESLDHFKSGVAHLAQRCPEIPVVPIFLHGLGKALPRGEALLVPFFCDVFVGEPMRFDGDRRAFLADLESRMHALAAEGHFAPWE